MKKIDINKERCYEINHFDIDNHCHIKRIKDNIGLSYCINGEKGFLELGNNVEIVSHALNIAFKHGRESIKKDLRKLFDI